MATTYEDLQKYVQDLQARGIQPLNAGPTDVGGGGNMVPNPPQFQPAGGQQQGGQQQSGQQPPPGWSYSGQGYQPVQTTTPTPFEGQQPNLPGWQYQGGGFTPVPITVPQPYQGGGFSPSTTPPPPPPPPPPPNFSAIAGGAPQFDPLSPYQTPEGAFQGEGMYGDLEAFAQDWMANPNRYLSDFAQAQRAASEARLSKLQEDQIRAIEEWAASRGLVGSSLEGDQRVQLAEAMRRAAAEEEAQLLRFLAEAETADRRSAGEFGLGVGEFGRGLGADRRGEAHFARDDELRVRELEMREGLDRARLALDAAIAGDQAAMDRVRAELDQFRALDAAQLSRDQLALQNEELNLRAHQIQQDAIMRGQELSLEQARLAAEYEFRQNQLAQQESQFQRDQAMAQQDIDLRAWQVYQDALLRGDAMSIEQARNIAEDEYRRNQLELDESQFGRSLGQARDLFQREQNMRLLEWLDRTEGEMSPEVRDALREYLGLPPSTGGSTGGSGQTGGESLRPPSNPVDGQIWRTPDGHTYEYDARHRFWYLRQ